MKNTSLKVLILICCMAAQSSVFGQKGNDPILEIAHFSDIHIRTEFNACNRFIKTI
jgi:hypothetical protein